MLACRAVCSRCDQSYCIIMQGGIHWVVWSMSSGGRDNHIWLGRQAVACKVSRGGCCHRSSQCLALLPAFQVIPLLHRMPDIYMTEGHHSGVRLTRCTSSNMDLMIITANMQGWSSFCGNPGSGVAPFQRITYQPVMADHASGCWHGVLHTLPGCRHLLCHGSCISGQWDHPRTFLPVMGRQSALYIAPQTMPSMISSVE